MDTARIAEKTREDLFLRDFEVISNKPRLYREHDENSYVVKRKYTTILRDENGNVIRGYEGIDMRSVYASKPVFYKVLKRFFDIVLSFLGLIILSPVFLILSIIIKLEDGGPVFFAGQRWGKDFVEFPMYKFRSMCVGAEEKTNEVLSEEDKNGMAFKIKNDPRVTKVGEFIRRTTLDELPQLWNVLIGQMSLVGPRPIQVIDNEKDPYVCQRWCIKPGITCFWQVSGRSLVPWDEWVEMDLEYINEMSLLTDIKILWYTVLAVIGMDGAV